MGMDDYVLKDVILVPTERSCRFDYIDGKWVKSVEDNVEDKGLVGRC
jgi:hypothetical protein